MTDAVIVRGNIVNFSFTFYDSSGDLASPDSAELQLTYVDHDGYRNKKVTLTEVSGAWTGTWDSKTCRGGWVHFHAHAIDGTDVLVQDGRFKLSANKANLQHDVLTGVTSGDDYIV